MKETGQVSLAIDDTRSRSASACSLIFASFAYGYRWRRWARPSSIAIADITIALSIEQERIIGSVGLFKYMTLQATKTTLKSIREFSICEVLHVLCFWERMAYN